jgi:hypothetical protein
MARDWLAWYERYDDPASSLSRRLAVVREQLAAVLETAPRPVRLISMCAGDGRDTLPVLAAVAPDTRATLVELEPTLADAARAAAERHALPNVTVHTADAGSCESYRDTAPADVLLACGVFGNITDADVATTVTHLPSLLAPGGVVIWTRGRRVDLDPTEVVGDPSEHTRALFGDNGFEEVAFVKPTDAGFRVGVHRLVADPAPYVVDRRLFSFVAAG